MSSAESTSPHVIHFSSDFDNTQSGAYQYNDWHNVWNPLRGQSGDFLTIAAHGENAGKYMRSTFPKGSYSKTPGGFNWETALPKGRDEIYFSYNVRFKSGFQWVLGGKLPGIRGGEKKTSACEYPGFDDGFTASLMWRVNGGLMFYTYNQNQEGPCGNAHNWNNFFFETNRWYNITIRVVVNEVVNEVGKPNGILEGFIDGKLKCQVSNVYFRNLESIKIDALKIYSFFGGSTEDHAAQRDEYIDFDDFYVFTYTDGVDVPRGRQLSKADRVLTLPGQQIDDTAWKASLTATVLNSTQVRLNWASYPISATYLLQRRTLPDGSFQQIASLSHGTLTYTNSSLSPNTEYEYRIRVNDSYTAVVKAKTQPLALPAPPETLTATSVTKTSITLGWADKSNNESGFRIERSTQPASGFTQIGSVAANTTSYTNNSLSANSTYHYRIRAYNGDGNSAYSNQIEVSTLKPVAPTPPSSLIATDITKTGLTLKWNDNSNNEKGFRVYRTVGGKNDFVLLSTTQANATSYSDNGLSAALEYAYRVTSFNDDGESASSASIQVHTLPVQPPVSPVGISALWVTKFSVLIQWIDFSANETGFEIYRMANDDQGFQLIETMAADSISFLDNTLEPDKVYFYRVRAINEKGSSAFTDTLQVNTPELIKPLPTSGLHYKDLTLDSVVLRWRDNSSIEKGFVVEISDSPDGKFTQLATVGANVTWYIYNFSENRKKTYFRVTAFNDDGFSPYGNLMMLDFPELLSPKRPYDIKEIALNHREVSFSWKDTTMYCIGFQVFRKTLPGGNLIKIGETGPDQPFYIDTVLIQRQAYQYQVRAINQLGLSPASEWYNVTVPFITLPDPPSALEPEKVSDRSVTIRWKDNSNNESGFLIQRTPVDKSSTEQVFRVNENDTIFTDPTVKPNTAYVYKVHATNELGPSEGSNYLKAYTLSMAESRRYRKNLIGYYNFSQDDIIIHDYSFYNKPLHLEINNLNAIQWPSPGRINILQDVEIKSAQVACKLTEAIKISNELTVECWFRPHVDAPAGESVIMKLGKNEDTIGVSLIQVKPVGYPDVPMEFRIALRTRSTNSSGTPYLVAESKFDYNTLYHLVYTYNRQGQERLYINGELAATSLKPDGLGNWGDDYYLYLAGDTHQHNTWTGNIYLAAIYDKSLDQLAVDMNYLAGPHDNLLTPQENYQLDVYPNPVSEQLHFRLKPIELNEVGERVEIQLLDLYGRLIHQQTMPDSSLPFDDTIEVNHLTAGVYLLRMVSASEDKTVKVIIR